VHFNWQKPWQQECTHPFADEFLKHLVGSAWEMSFARRGLSAALPDVPKRKRRFKEYSRSLRRTIGAGMQRIFGRRAA
jgi:hypothetical protein